MQHTFTCCGLLVILVVVLLLSAMDQMEGFVDTSPVSFPTPPPALPTPPAPPALPTPPASLPILPASPMRTDIIPEVTMSPTDLQARQTAKDANLLRDIQHIVRNEIRSQYALSPSCS